jgi:small neutral amino acid transporter SnatA (MarC family)
MDVSASAGWEESMIQFTSINATTVADLFLLLLIGIGPKIALVPYINATAGMDAATRRRVVRKMLTTAVSVALVLIVFGGLLTRLLHFSTGALSVAGGIILLILACAMILDDKDEQSGQQPVAGREPMQLAAYPLAVPYLLNPAGIVLLVMASAEAATFGLFIVILGLLAVVIALDAAVFLWANQIREHLDAERMLVVEKVFGFLLGALAVQLVLNGLSIVGAIHLIAH